MSDVEQLLRYLREPEAGTLLGQDEYVRDFGSRLWLADGADSWKVERMQFYDETGFPSWDAFAAGDWERSVELYDDLRPALLSFNQQHAEHHAQFRRIRVVEAAISPYVQWEMYCLRVRSECGEDIRVVPAAQLADLEAAAGLVPELVSLCGMTLYLTGYDAAALPDGAQRFTDPGIVARYETFVRGLYDSGEDLETYFGREIAPLPAPHWRGDGRVGSLGRLSCWVPVPRLGGEHRAAVSSSRDSADP